MRKFLKLLLVWLLREFITPWRKHKDTPPTTSNKDTL